MTPQIIRTPEELEALDPDTVIETVDRARVSVSLARRMSDLFVPAVVIAPGEQVRDARKALGGAVCPASGPSRNTNTATDHP